MNKNLLLACGIGLLCIGLFKPNLSNFIPSVNMPDTKVVVVKPSDENILNECNKVVKALQDGGSSRMADGTRLASLYLDIANLIELTGNDEVVRNTEEIRQANYLSGTMLKLNIKDKYPSLKEAAESLIATSIGKDNVTLDPKTRQKAADAFRALAWACAEGSK